MWTAFKSERWTGFMSKSPAAFIGIRNVPERAKPVRGEGR